MPAVVSSTEGSCTDGTSDAEGTILCPRSSKKDRYVRRISSTLTRRSLRSCDHAVADNEVAVEQAGDLPRRRPVHGLGQGDHRLARIAVHLEAALAPRGVVAEPHAVDPLRRPVKTRIAQPDTPGGELGAGAGSHGVGGRVRPDHIERLAAPHAQTPSLPHGEVMVPVVLAEAPAAPVDDLARAPIEAGVATQELSLALAGEEAEVLALRASGDLQSRVRRDLAHLRLAQLCERKAKARQGARAEPREHVGLVLARVRGGREQRPVSIVGDARVMAGDKFPGA